MARPRAASVRVRQEHTVPYIAAFVGGIAPVQPACVASGDSNDALVEALGIDDDEACSWLGFTCGVSGNARGANATKALQTSGVPTVEGTPGDTFATSHFIRGAFAQKMLSVGLLAILVGYIHPRANAGCTTTQAAPALLTVLFTVFEELLSALRTLSYVLSGLFHPHIMDGASIICGV